MNKMTVKNTILIVAVFISGKAFSIVDNQRVLTPRGLEVEVTIHASSTGQKNPTIIIAPGQSCNSKGPIFETLGNRGALANFTIVRFEWAYCLKDPTQPIPSADLKNEIEDFNTVLEYSRSLSYVDSNKLVIAGKSLGSVVAYSVFKSTPDAKSLALLTPICSYTTDEGGNPLPVPQQVCEESYPGLKEESRPIYLTMGDRDDLCILNILFDYLKDSKGNVLVNVAGGDHGFRLKKTDGTPDSDRTQRNIDVVIGSLLNWADLKLSK
jgi:predicted alpha/beta-hydrolase family hydrolase